MRPAREFIGRVIDSGRITIPKDTRETLGIEDGDHLRVSVAKLDLFRTSMHRFYAPERTKPMTEKQVSTTRFG